MKRTIRFFLGGIMLTAVSALPLAAQDFGFTIVNGTGRTITGIEIQPSRKLYGRGKKDGIGLSLVILNQQEEFIALPKRLRGFEEFDIALKYSGKNAKTGNGVVLTGGSNRFVAYLLGESPTVPLAAAGVAAGGVAAIVSGMGTVVLPLATSIAVFGPSIAAPLVVFPPAAVVVAAAAGAGFGTYQAVKHFTPHTLVMAPVGN